MNSSPIILQIPPSLKMNDEQFFEFCQINRDYRIERDKSGEISIMAPTGGTTGNRNGNIFGEVYIWSKQDGAGICFDSSTGFKLSTGADRSPDISWIRLDRWNGLLQEEQDKFAPICPDFVIELMSPSDSLKPLQEKMEEYMQEPGVRLGWLIDRKNRCVYVYRPGKDLERLDNPSTMSGEEVLPGFVLDMGKVW